MKRLPKPARDIIVESDGQLKQDETVDYETEEHISYNMGLNATTNTGRLHESREYFGAK